MPGLYPAESLYPSEGLWPSTAPFIVENPPAWSESRRFTVRAGVPAGYKGTTIYHPRGYTLDLGDAVEIGGMTTADPWIKGALRESGLFDEVDP
jgi:hypothetical protein